ncbi:MAG: hypothetical protein ACE5IB_02020 [Candidatus Geothermarchaeales archaeon]
MVVVLFDLWLPAIEGAILLIVAIEQLYLFRFIFQGFVLLKDRLLLLVSLSFIIFAAGSLLSSTVAFWAFSLLLRNPVSAAGFEVMSSVVGILSAFQFVGFLILVLSPPLLKGELLESGMAPQLLVIAGVAAFREYFVGAALVAVAMLFLLIVSKTRSFATIESNAIMVALLTLFFSKWVILLPFPFRAMDVISIIMDAVAFSSLVVLRETIAFSMPARAGGGRAGEV